MLSPKILFAGAAVVALAACQPTPPAQNHAQAAKERGLKIVADCAAVQCATLNLDNAYLPDFSTLASMPHIDKLMVSYSNLQSLTPLLAMTQLTELHIGLTAVKDLSEIGTFKRLKLLHAQSLHLTDISAVAQLTELEELVIGSYKLTDISVLKGLKNLKKLDISHSAVADISALGNLPKLETLELLNTTALQDLSPLLRFPRLKSVSLSVHILSDAGKKIVEQLQAKGVKVTVEEIMVVC